MLFLYVHYTFGIVLPKLSVVLLLTAVLMLSVTVSTIPASNALIQRNYNYVNDNPLTVLTGDTKVCGDHLCAPGEWSKLQQHLAAVQLGNQTGSNTTSQVTSSWSWAYAQIGNQTGSNTAIPSTPKTSATTTTSGTQIASTVCTIVKNALSSANINSVTTHLVLSKLGC